jgi:acetylornithine deacetylase
MSNPEFNNMLSQLIATPSVSCISPDLDQSNLPVIQLLAGWLQDCGFAVEIMPVNERKANLLARLGSATDDGGLVLAGHTDTVPFDADRWHFDPFKLSASNNRLYGLGTSDMKSFFAFAITAAMSYKKSEYKKPLTILATADEETSMDGARALLAAGKPRAHHAIIGEPTGLKPIRGHKGVLMEAVRITGLAGHSSNPALGHNALEAMHIAIAEILRWRNELQQRYRNDAFDVPVPTLNLGHIHGGDNPNRICGACELHIDIRPLPGMPLEELRDEMQQRLQAVMPASGFTLETFPLFCGIPATETPAQSAIVQAAERLTGMAAANVAFGTEAPFLNQLGMNTIILGPGDIAQAHQPDEYIDMTRIQPTLDLLRKFIYQFCIA